MRTVPLGAPLVRQYMLLLLLLLGTPAAVAQDTRESEDALGNLTQELIELRGEVQELNTELQDAREQHRNRMSSLERQRGELQAERNRIQLRTQKLEESLAAARQEAREAGVGAEELKPVVLASLEVRRREIDEQLPFKRDERVAELNDIQRQLESGGLTPHRAVNRLWGFYEDEISLASENGLYRQTIDLDGEERLAEVARVGTVMMFFRTSDGKLGRAVKDGRGDGWRYQLIDDAKSRDQVAKLFDAMEKQIRSGYFTLPNALVENGGSQ